VIVSDGLDCFAPLGRARLDGLWCAIPDKTANLYLIEKRLVFAQISPRKRDLAAIRAAFNR
jgi:hypothetical protein